MGDGGGDLQFQQGFLELHVGGGRRPGRAAGNGHIADFRTLLDVAFALVGGNDAGIGNHLAAPFFLQRRKLQVQVEVRAEQGVGQRRFVDPFGKAAGGQVDVQAPDRGGSVCAQAAANRGDVGAIGMGATDAELGAQVAGEGIGRHHDAALDQHLVHRTVDVVDQLAHLRHLLRDVADHQGVGALVGDDAAARREEAVLLVLAAIATAFAAADALGLGQRLEDRGRRVVVDLDVVRDQVLAVLDGDARVFLVLLELGQLRLRRDPDHAAIAALVQPLCTQDDVQCLVPRYVDQAQRHAALDRVRGDDVEIGFLGDQLQDRAHRHVLEVEGHRLARVGLGRGHAQLGRPCGLAGGGADGGLSGPGADLDHELVFGLVGQRLHRALGVEHQLRALAGSVGLDALHRGGEIDHVHRLLQRGRHAHVGQVHDHLAIFGTQVGRGAFSIETQDQSARSVFGAAKVDVRNLHRTGLRSTCRCRSLGGEGRSNTGHGCDRQHQCAQPVSGRAPQGRVAVSVASGHRVCPLIIDLTSQQLDAPASHRHHRAPAQQARRGRPAPQ
jgi:hypothetical protein